MCGAYGVAVQEAFDEPREDWCDHAEGEHVEGDGKEDKGGGAAPLRPLGGGAMVGVVPSTGVTNSGSVRRGFGVWPVELGCDSDMGWSIVYVAMVASGR